jgi:alcohol dehydrogenase (cytochrome c)
MSYRDALRLKNFAWGMIAGFAGVTALSILMLIKSRLGLLPELNPIADIVNILNGYTGADLPMAAGWVGHFVIGSIAWGAAYALLEPIFPGPAIVKGLVFALIAWLAMMILFMPLAGRGFFAMSLGAPLALATLVVHLVYGAVLGVVYARLAGRSEVVLDSRLKHVLDAIFGAVAALGVAAAVVIYLNFGRLVPIAADAINYLKYRGAPAGALSIEVNPNAPARALASAPVGAGKAEGDWPSYNKTLTSDRFSDLNQINRTNAGKLKVLCTYDTGEHTGFNSGLLEVDGALVFATEFDLFSIDPSTCKENWRAHESYKPATPQGVNRGAAYMDGALFRGTQDGRVLAYDFKTGQRLWETRIADPNKGESAPAAPIAWKGLVFIGNAGGDIKGVKGRMYALDAKTGEIVWEFFLVPKGPDDPVRGPLGRSPLDESSWGNEPPGMPITGGATWTSYSLDPDTGLLYVPGGNPAPDFAPGLRPGSNLYSGSVVVLDAKTGDYRNHFKIVPKDWHDWDVSGAPAIVKTAGGKKVMLLAPKDGYLYGFDLASNAELYKQPATRIENAEAPFSTEHPVHFCPGSTGGAEWNGPAYDPQTNQVYIGEVEWCTKVRVKPETGIRATPLAAPWSGEASVNPFNMWGAGDPDFDWAGWVTAFDADTGEWRWRAKTNYPIQSGMTPTAGGIVFFGDMGGNFYVLDASNGAKLWSKKIGGAIGGGVITYGVDGKQRIAAATGLTEILWPTEITTAKVSVLGLE